MANEDKSEYKFLGNYKYCLHVSNFDSTIHNLTEAPTAELFGIITISISRQLLSYTMSCWYIGDTQSSKTSIAI